MKHTLITCRGVWPENGLLTLGDKLCQERASNVQTRDHVTFGQLEDELLGVVVDILGTLKYQRDEALITACESGFRRSGDLAQLFLCLILDLGSRRGVQEVVADSANTDGAGGDICEGIGTTLYRLGRVRAG